MYPSPCTSGVGVLSPCTSGVGVFSPCTRVVWSLARVPTIPHTPGTTHPPHHCTTPSLPDPYHGAVMGNVGFDEINAYGVLG